jgi:hypothetical protein
VPTVVSHILIAIALLITAVNLTCVAVFMKLFTGRRIGDR